MSPFATDAWSNANYERINNARSKFLICRKNAWLLAACAGGGRPWWRDFIVRHTSFHFAGKETGYSLGTSEAMIFSKGGSPRSESNTERASARHITYHYGA